MPQTWKYVGNVILPETVSDAITEEWADTLGAESNRIFSSMTTKINNAGAYGTKMATPAVTQYNTFLKSVGDAWDIDRIKLKHKVKVLGGYNRWLASVTAVFGGLTPTFPTIVNSKKHKLVELRRVIGAVGHKSLGTWEPVSMAVLLARGDTRCAKYFDDNDDWTGTLEACFDAQKGALISPSLIAEMVYVCVTTRYMYEAGLTADIAAFLTAENAVIAELVAVALNAAHYPAEVAKFSIVLSWNDTNKSIDVTAEDIL